MKMMSVQQVCKTYNCRTRLRIFGSSKIKTIKALDKINMSVEAGSITALVGPNGAGKTTLINAICGLMLPDSGKIYVCGHNMASDAREGSKKIGLVTTNDRSFFWRLTGRQNIRFFGSLYGLSPH